MNTPDFEPGDLVEIVLELNSGKECRIVVYGGETDNYIRCIGVANMSLFSLEWKYLPLSRARLTWNSIIECRHITETDNWPLEQLTDQWLELSPQDLVTFLERTKAARDLLSER